ncbi:uncharacterized protein CDAR_43102 [Caerostris darwini]|uniref:Uncharacterized protein n=1 Tax=Caerostris darwini TaxID=1538125 RepID=A0AAV4WH53_9ARAC|nr:uncharacterized protein CDAR_43102 [Caerostris darwini]
MLSGHEAFSFSCKLLSLRVGALLSVCCIIRQKFVCLEREEITSRHLKSRQAIKAACCLAHYITVYSTCWFRLQSYGTVSGFRVGERGKKKYHLAEVWCDERWPGRPPKRATMVGMNPNGANHSMLLKKSRMDGEYPGYENGHIGGDRVDKSHLLANGYSHHVAAAQAAVVAATAGAPPHLNPLPFMALNHAAAAAAHHNSMMSGTLPLAASSSHGHLNSSSSSGRGPESSSVIKERNSHTSDVINSTR